MHKIITYTTTTALIIGLLFYARYDTLTRTYGRKMTVDKVSGHTLTLIDDTDNIWEYDTKKDIKAGTDLIVLLDNKDTASIYDDEILKISISQ